MKKTALAALTLATLALGACGGGGSTSGGSTAPSSEAPASSPAADPGSSGGASPDASAGASPSVAPAGQAGDPCKVLDAAAVEEISGVEVQDGTSQSAGTTTVCTWLPKDGTKSGAAVFSGQEGPLPGPLSQVEDELKSQFDGKVTTIQVPGADDARYITGKKSGLSIIDVLAQKDGVFYQVLVAAPRDVDSHKAAAVTIAERLIKG